MSTLAIVILIVLMIILLVGGLLIITKGGSLSSPFSQTTSAQTASLRTLVQAQRSQNELLKEGGTQKDRKMKDNLAFVAAEDPNLSRKKLSQSSALTMEKRLKYAQWNITPLQFRLIQILATVAVYMLARIQLALPMQLLALALTPSIVDSFLKKAIDKRFMAFDADYPVLLLSYVSLLKTGMSTIAGLETAARGLDQGSLVRSECELMIERLKLGLTEEQAINSFGDDIAHPELELFVQSLLLSRKVGGTLSTTLERLAKQVRKRQQFRHQAKAAVGLEQGSIYAIAVIMSLLMAYMVYASPDLVLPALHNEFGAKIFQGGLALIIVGFWWSKKVTNIKI